MDERGQLVRQTSCASSRVRGRSSSHFRNSRVIDADALLIARILRAGRHRVKCIYYDY
jgi:hypothetical protein